MNKKYQTQSNKQLGTTKIESEKSEDFESERLITVREIRSFHAQIVTLKDALDNANLSKEISTHDLRKKLTFMETAYEKVKNKLRELETNNSMLSKDLTNYKDKKKISDIQLEFNTIDDETRKKNYEAKLKQNILELDKSYNEYIKRELSFLDKL